MSKLVNADEPNEDAFAGWIQVDCLAIKHFCDRKLRCDQGDWKTIFRCTVADVSGKENFRKCNKLNSVNSRNLVSQQEQSMADHGVEIPFRADIQINHLTWSDSDNVNRWMVDDDMTTKVAWKRQLIAV